MAMRIDGAAAVHGPTGGNAATPAPVLLASPSGGGRHAARQCPARRCLATSPQLRFAGAVRVIANRRVEVARHRAAGFRRPGRVGGGCCQAPRAAQTLPAPADPALSHFAGATTVSAMSGEPRWGSGSAQCRHATGCCSCVCVCPSTRQQRHTWATVRDVDRPPRKLDGESKARR